MEWIDDSDNDRLIRRTSGQPHYLDRQRHARNIIIIQLVAFRRWNDGMEWMEWMDKKSLFWWYGHTPVETARNHP